MKRRVCWFLLFLALGFFVFGQFFSVLMPVSAVSTSTSVSADPLPPIIPPNTNYTIIDETVYIEQDVEIQSNATLFLKNAILYVEKKDAKITFKDSRLQAISSTLTSQRDVYFDVYFNGSSSASADMLTIEKRGRLHAYDSSIVSISGGKIKGMVTAHNSSTILLSTVKIEYNSILGVESGLSSYDSSRVTISKSTVEWLRAFDLSTVSIFDTMFKERGMRCYDSSVVFISSARIKGVNFIAYDFSFITFVNSLITINLTRHATSLEAYNSSKVWVLSTRVKGSLSARGSSDVRIENSEEVWLLSASDSSVVSVYNSNVALLRTHDSSVTSILESRTKLLRAYDSSAIYVSRSTVEELFIYCGSVNCSIVGLTPSSFKEWNFWLDSSVVVAPSGYAPDVTLEETQIQRGWGFSLFDSSNVTISDSTLEYLGLSDSSVVRLISSTVTYHYIISEAKVYVYWYLDVHVASGANVRVLYPDAYPDGTVADYRWNVTNGLTRFTLVEKMMDVSGTYLFDPYTVKAISNGYSDEQSVEIMGNQSVTMTPPLPLWQQYWHVIIAFVAVAATLAIVSFIIRKRKFT